jgi:hypothetical protein
MQKLINWGYRQLTSLNLFNILKQKNYDKCWYTNPDFKQNQQNMSWEPTLNSVFRYLYRYGILNDFILITGEVHSIQHYVIKFVSVTCDMLVVFSEHSVFWCFHLGKYIISTIYTITIMQKLINWGYRQLTSLNLFNILTPINWTSRYNWNIVTSGVKYHDHNPKTLWTEVYNFRYQWMSGGWKLLWGHLCKHVRIIQMCL